MQIDQTGWIFLAIAGLCFVIVLTGLVTGKTLGIAFRSRFIAQRGRDPALFGCSLFLFAAFGALLLFAVIAVGFGWFAS